MSQMKPPQKGVPRSGPNATLPPTIMTEKISTYAFGTVVSCAVMVAVAAWMGGSLASIDDRLQAGLDVIADSAGFSVEEISIEGLDARSKADVLNAISIAPGWNMFRADPFLIKERIEALETVGSVRVMRQWPRDIWIIAEPRTPLAVWQLDNEWRVVDQHGAPMQSEDPQDYAQLPRVVGPDGAAAAPELLAQLAETPAFAEHVETAVRVGDRRWDLHLDTGVELVMPEDADFTGALVAVMELHDRTGVLDGGVERIDARDSHRFAILMTSDGAPLTTDSGGA